MNHSKLYILYTGGTALLIALMFKLLFFKPSDVIGFDLILVVLIIMFLWEGNKKIDAWLNTKYSWINAPGKRVSVQAIACALFTSSTLFLLMFTLHQVKFGDGRLIDGKMRQIFLPALFFALALIAIYIGFNFFSAWKQSLIELEKYKTAVVNAQLQNLKSQLNPHFLFNNLSVLSSLVYQNQEKAVHFIKELSKVYHYILDHKNVEVVRLQNELDFLEHYIYLLKIRFEHAISFSLHINKKESNLYLPPMCIQILIENTIQHNEASKANPLKVSIYADHHTLRIENNIQPRSDISSSTKTGLENIKSRYSFFTERQIEICNTGKIFGVTLPLLRKDESCNNRR